MWVWQVGGHSGFTRHHEPDSLVWAEHHSKGFARTREFYAPVFGWGYAVASDTDDVRYRTAEVEWWRWPVWWTPRASS